MLTWMLAALLAQTPQLTPVWTYDTGDSLEAAKGGGRPPALEATPAYRDGRLYIATPWGTIAALDARTGKEVWRTSVHVDPKGSYGDFANRGVTLGRDLLYSGTVDGRLICRQISDGRPCPAFGTNGEIDLKVGLRIPPKWAGEYEVTSAPALFKDLIITGSAIADNSRARMASGEVRAYDARTGALRWTFYPLPENTQAGGANTWSRIVADESTGLVFLPTGSASPDYYGGLRPGDNRHANSVVALRGATGEVAWSFQTVHHDIWDYDVASAPELYEVKGHKAIAIGSKTGHLFLLDRLTGKPLFGVDERPVPRSTVEGETASATQPVPRKPAPLVRQKITDSDVRPACLDLLHSLRNEGVFTPPSIEGSLVVPGNIGGMHWGGVTWAKGQDVLVVPVNDLPAIVKLTPQAGFKEARKTRQGYENTEQSGTPYGMSRKMFTDDSGTPCTTAPLGSVVGISTTTGDILWKSPLGKMPNLGGIAVSSKGIAWVGAEFLPFLRAFDVRTGKQLGEWPLPTSARATPAIYTMDGKEYLVISAGGHLAEISKLDTKIVAFRLD